jgi:hypothetical protein
LIENHVKELRVMEFGAELCEMGIQEDFLEEVTFE